jgi:hypothetical protein
MPHPTHLHVEVRESDHDSQGCNEGCGQAYFDDGLIAKRKRVHVHRDKRPAQEYVLEGYTSRSCTLARGASHATRKTRRGLHTLLYSSPNRSFPWTSALVEVEYKQPVLMLTQCIC